MGLVFISFLPPGWPTVCCLVPPAPHVVILPPLILAFLLLLCSGRGLWPPPPRQSCPTSWPWAQPGSELRQCPRPPDSAESLFLWPISPPASNISWLRTHSCLDRKFPDRIGRWFLGARLLWAEWALSLTGPQQKPLWPCQEWEPWREGLTR